VTDFPFALTTLLLLLTDELSGLEINCLEWTEGFCRLVSVDSIRSLFLFEPLKYNLKSHVKVFAVFYYISPNIYRQCTSGRKMSRFFKVSSEIFLLQN
jgi:hypothetical protein